MPNTLHRKKLVIVGCGAAATLLLAELASTTNNSPSDIYVIDDNPSAPAGLAYAVNHPTFVLNVAAKRMGAYINAPDHFYQWLLTEPEHWRNLHPDFSTVNYAPDDFVPRMIYAAYLQTIFRRSVALLEQNNNSVIQLNEQVVDVSPQANDISARTCISTTRQKNLPDITVFATGNNPARKIAFTGEECFSSPYTTEFANQNWSNMNNVVIIGSGLSMIDSVQFISSQGFAGNFHIFSCHGLLPLPHSEEHPMAAAPLFDPEQVGNNAIQVLRALRLYVESNLAAGFEWQESINKIRPHVSGIWARLSIIEQLRLAKVLPWWNIHRHRISPLVNENLQQLREQQRLHISRGCVIAVEGTNDGFQLRLKQSFTLDKILNVAADKLVICSGYAPGFNRVKNLCGKLLSPEEQLRHLLVNGDTTFKVSATHNIFALGPALSGLLFETTALHETRQQANKIAATVSVLLHQNTISIKTGIPV